MNGNPSATPTPPYIEILTQFLNSLHSYSVDLVQHLQSGQTLCHYTSLEGALGIIGNRDLWLTNARFSNDDEEMDYGIRLLERVLDEMIAKARRKPIERERLRQIREQVQAVQGEHVYVCCFCERNNLLSQWRGYADNAGGISIEFDPDGFTAVTGPDSPQGLMRLWKVFYDEAQQRRIIRDCIDYPGWAVVPEDQRIQSIVRALQFFLPTFKNPDFQEEQERRLIFTPAPAGTLAPRFRSSRGMLVPYFSLSELASSTGRGFALPIKQVLIGPSRHRAMNVDSARMLLRARGYDHVPVEASPTPYRG